MAWSNVIGIVLAGGASRRMGQDKAGLAWTDGTLLDHACDLLHPLCAEVLVSGKTQGIADRARYGGPVQALHSVVLDPRTNAFDAMIICAVDTPLLQSDDFSFLLAALSIHNAAFYQQHYLPLALRLNHENRQIIARIADAENPSMRSMRHLCQQLNAIEIATSAHQRERLINLNTPALYQDYFQQQATANGTSKS